MRHALVTVHLAQTARATADAEAGQGTATDAPPEPRVDSDRQPGRLATLARRARARTFGLRAETPGGGA